MVGTIKETEESEETEEPEDSYSLQFKLLSFYASSVSSDSSVSSGSFFI